MQAEIPAAVLQVLGLGCRRSWLRYGTGSQGRPAFRPESEQSRAQRTSGPSRSRRSARHGTGGWSSAMRRASASSTRRPRSPDAPVFEDELRLLLRDDYSLEHRRKVLPYKNPADFEAVVDGLRKAGLVAGARRTCRNARPANPLYDPNLEMARLLSKAATCAYSSLASAVSARPL